VLRHIGAGAVFVSNFVLWREAGYFDAPARLKPLLHLGSLGIEEQFYLCWPPIVYFCARHSRRAVTIAAALALASFTLNVAFARSAESAVFYLPVTRIWELLLAPDRTRAASRRRVLPAGLANWSARRASHCWPHR
jgi:peptidoglycan/LPS O-acetylase OafA/YrhL